MYNTILYLTSANSTLYIDSCITTFWLVEADLSNASFFWEKRPPNHAAELRYCPCRPRARQGVELEVNSGLRSNLASS